MSRARNLADLLDANGDVASGALDNAVPADGSITTAKLASTLDLSGKTVTLPAGTGGKVLQVVSTTKTDTVSVAMSAGAEAAITGLSATITPTSASSTILVMVNVNGSRSGSYPIIAYRVKRGTTLVGVGNAAGSRSRTTSAALIVSTDTAAAIAQSNSFVDSPATTSATTYSVYFVNTSGLNRTMYLNRSVDDTDAANHSRSISTITLMEIAA